MRSGEPAKDENDDDDDDDDDGGGGDDDDDTCLFSVYQGHPSKAN